MRTALNLRRDLSYAIPEKKIMITALAHFIISLQEEVSSKFIAIFMGCCVLFLCSGLYYIHSKSTQLVRGIQQARSLATKTDELIGDYNAITQEENNLAELLSKKTDYSNLKSYFERFCQASKITPEPGWAETTEVKEITGSDRFEEEYLHAQIKNVKMRELVTYIDAIEKDDLINLKELDLEKTDKTLSVKMVIAAKRFKRTMEE